MHAGKSGGTLNQRLAGCMEDLSDHDAASLSMMKFQGNELVYIKEWFL